MATTPSAAERRQNAAAYASAVTEWLLPGARSARARSDEDEANNLLSGSAALRVTAATGLTTGDPLETAAAEVQLLAGAALDLIVAGRLAGAAPAARSLTPAAEPSSSVLRLSSLTSLDDLAELRAIIEAPQAYLVGAAAVQAAQARPGRGLRALAGPADDLTAAVHAGLGVISHNAVTAGSGVVEGLLLLDFAAVRAALNMVGGDLAKELGTDLAQISGRVLDFLLSANEKIIALTGLDALSEAQRAAQKLLTSWVGQLRDGTLYAKLAGRVLSTKAVETEIAVWLAAYSGPDDALTATREQVNQLAGQYAAKARVVQKVSAGLGLVRLAPPLRTPVGSIAVGVVHLSLLAYVLGSAYDHVDSDRIALLDRVEGVRGVARRALVTSPPGPLS